MATVTAHCTIPTGAPGGNWSLINGTNTSTNLAASGDGLLIGLTDDLSGETSHLRGFDWSAILAGSVINSVTVVYFAGMVSTGAGTVCPFNAKIYLGANSTSGASNTPTVTFTTYTDANMARPGGGSWSYSDLANLQATMNNAGTGTNTKVNRVDEFKIIVDYTPPGLKTITW